MALTTSPAPRIAGCGSGCRSPRGRAAVERVVQASYRRSKRPAGGPSVVPSGRAWYSVVGRSYRPDQPGTAPSDPCIDGPSVVPSGRAWYGAVGPLYCAAEPRTAPPSLVLRRRPLVLRRRASSCAAEPRSAPSNPCTAPRSLVPSGRAWYRAVGPLYRAADPRTGGTSLVPRRRTLVPRRRTLVPRRGAWSRAVRPLYRRYGARTDGTSVVPPLSASNRPVEPTPRRPPLRSASLPSAARPERNLYPWGANLPRERSAQRPHLGAAPRTSRGIHRLQGELAAGRRRGPRRASTCPRRGRSLAAIAPSRTGNKSKKGTGNKSTGRVSNLCNQMASSGPYRSERKERSAQRLTVRRWSASSRSPWRARAHREER